LKKWQKTKIFSGDGASAPRPVRQRPPRHGAGRDVRGGRDPRPLTLPILAEEFETSSSTPKGDCVTAPTATIGHRGLKIEKIECIPLLMPLPRTYRGSNYFMTHRCTIITRLYTSEGIVGEVYNGDEFETQAEVLKIINEEIAPRVIGMDAFNTEG